MARKRKARSWAERLAEVFSPEEIAKINALAEGAFRRAAANHAQAQRQADLASRPRRPKRGC